MEFGAHLPLMDFGGHPFTLDHLTHYVRTAAALGFDAVSANDHLVFSVPWLDGPTALAAAIGHSGTMTLATTVALPVVRGPVRSGEDARRHRSSERWPSHGRRRTGLVAVGLSRSRRRLRRTMGAPRRVDRRVAIAAAGRCEAVRRPLLHDRRAHAGAASDRARRVRPSGSAVGARMQGSGGRRVSADGWLASAYNISPSQFDEAWTKLRELLPADGKEPSTFPNSLATMWCYITDSHAEADRVMTERIVPSHPPSRRRAARPAPGRSCRGVRGEAERVRSRRRAASLHLARRGRGSPARAVLDDGATARQVMTS